MAMLEKLAIMPKSMSWAVATGLIRGITRHSFVPRRLRHPAQAATLAIRFRGL